jgi:hypothetical protein
MTLQHTHQMIVSSAFFLLILARPIPAYSTIGVNDSPYQTPTTKGNSDIPQASDTGNLVVTDNIAVVHFSPSRWDRLPLLGNNTANETVFLIRPIKENISNAVVTSSGLGNAVFIREDALKANSWQLTDGIFARVLNAVRNIRTCPEPLWNGTTSMTLSNLKMGEEVKIRMRFPCDLVSDPGDTLEGKILVIAGLQKPLEVPLKIQAPAASSFYTALLWFLGVVIPTLIGYGIYKLQNNWTEQRAQWATLDKYIYDNRQILDDFFTIHYKQIFADQGAKFASGLREAFVKRNIVDQIPPRQRRKFEKAIGRCSRRSIQRRLVKFFPVWKRQINGQFDDV